jgi:soluble lytic murein transglycosylase-like protein
MSDLVGWQLGRENIFSFKNQWVHGNRSAINAAAKRFDLPPGLVAGVAYNEVGGDPQSIDSLAYALRGDSTRDRTSFGDLSVQVRRAAEALGYDPSNDLSPSQRRMLIESLKDPTQNIFIAAKHLADLRDKDFKGVRGADL